MWQRTQISRREEPISMGVDVTPRRDSATEKRTVSKGRKSFERNSARNHEEEKTTGPISTRKRRTDFDERRDLVDFADVIRRRGCRARRKKKRKTTVWKKSTKNKKGIVSWCCENRFLVLFFFKRQCRFA